MAIEVAKVELKNVQDASGLEACIAAGQFTADEVIAVIGKTEGNGGVNDFTRILADQAFRKVLGKRGRRSEAEIAQIPMVWSGGCDGVITPHATVFARNAKSGPSSQMRLAIGTAMSATLLPEDIGRPAMVEKVAQAVKAAMANAGISDPKDVHYVQTKTPLLTIETVRDAEARGKHVACEVHEIHGRIERHYSPRDRGGAGRNQNAAVRANLQRSGSLFLGRVMLVRRRIERSAGGPPRQQSRRRRALPHRPFRHAGCTRRGRHL